MENGVEGTGVTTKSLKLLLAALLLTHCALSTAAEDPTEQTDARLEAYLNKIDTVETFSGNFARENGKEALIERYRSILERYPAFPKSVEIETRIARIYRWDLSEYGHEPTDKERALQLFESILSRYGPQEPYMKSTMQQAANLFIVQGYPDEARSLYQSMIQLYPEDDNVRLFAYVALGRLARKDGQLEKADEYFSLVMKYDPKSLPDRKERERAYGTRKNAAANLIAIARNPHWDAPPNVRLAAINDLLERYPEIHYLQRQLVSPLLVQLHKEIAAEKEKKLNELEQKTADLSQGDQLPAKARLRRSGFQSRPTN